jgi:RNA polymerase sigma factor for flagellar operon FliA
MWLGKMATNRPSQQNRRPTAERDRLIASHLDIARRISLRMARRCPAWISSDDLVAAGRLGLLEAAERYDETRQEPFLVFAEKRIRGAVLDELRRGDIMPRRVRQMARKVGATIQDLEKKHGAPVADTTVASALGVSIETYRADLEQLVHVTIGALDQLDHRPPTAGDESSPMCQAERREIMDRIKLALTQLDQRDVLILSLYYNEELTYVEIGKVLDVTTSRVCQLHGRAIARLRAELENTPATAGRNPTAAAKRKRDLAQAAHA